MALIEVELVWVTRHRNDEVDDSPSWSCGLLRADGDGTGDGGDSAGSKRRWCLASVHDDAEILENRTFWPLDLFQSVFRQRDPLAILGLLFLGTTSIKRLDLTRFQIGCPTEH